MRGHLEEAWALCVEPGAFGLPAACGPGRAQALEGGVGHPLPNQRPPGQPGFHSGLPLPLS